MWSASNSCDPDTASALLRLRSQSIKVILDILVRGIMQLETRQHTECQNRSNQVKLTECETIEIGSQYAHQ